MIFESGNASWSVGGHVALPDSNMFSVLRDILQRIFESDEPHDLGKLLGVPKSTVATLLKRGTFERKRRGIFSYCLLNDIPDLAEVILTFVT